MRVGARRLGSAAAGSEPVVLEPVCLAAGRVVLAGGRRFQTAFEKASPLRLQAKLSGASERAT
jgi:hypothetical protein